MTTKTTKSAVSDWATWAARAIMGMLASGLIWAGSNIVLAAERIEKVQAQVSHLEARLERDEERSVERTDKVAAVVEDHGKILERTSVTLANLREKIDAVLAKLRK